MYVRGHEGCVYVFVVSVCVVCECVCKCVCVLVVGNVPGMTYKTRLNNLNTRLKYLDLFLVATV